MLNFLVSSCVQSPGRLVFRLSELEYSPGLTMNQNTEQRWWVLPVSLTVRVRLSCAVQSVPTTLIRAPAPYWASETATAAPTPTVVTTQVGFDPDFSLRPRLVTLIRRIMALAVLLCFVLRSCSYFDFVACSAL